METVLYFQSPSKTSTPDKIAGARRHAAIANWHIQVLEELPSSKSVQALCEFWNPIGAIVECGGGYQDINPDVFKIPVVSSGNISFSSQNSTYEIAERLISRIFFDD